MNLEEYKGVYVFAQQVDNEISSIAFELLGKAKELAAPLQTEVTAVLIGSGIKGLADKLAEYGKKLNNYVLKNEGDIFELKKLADELSRDFYKDIVELKAWKNCN